MDIEFIENHPFLVVQVVERLLFCLAVGGLGGTERRVASLGELHPHLQSSHFYINF